MIKLIKWIINKIKVLFKKKGGLSFNDILPDFQDRFEFGLYAHASWYNFESKLIPYDEIRVMGIDFVYEQYSGIKHIVNAIKEAKKAGLKVLINGTYNIYNLNLSNLVADIKAAFDTLEDYKNNTFLGVLAYDEPHTEQCGNNDRACLPWIKKNIVDKFKSSELGGKCFINCLPNYARQSQIVTGDYISSEEYVDQDSYSDYVAKCAEISDVVCGDFYGPFTGKKEVLWEPYLKTMQQVSKAYNKPLWQFVSCVQQGGALYPTLELLKHRIVMNVIFGAQAIIFFKMMDYSSDGAPWDKNREKSPTYYMLQELLTDEIFKFQLGLFRNANIISTTNKGKHYEVLLNKNNHRYHCFYALEDTVIDCCNKITPDGISLVNNNRCLLEKGSLLISLVK